MAVPKLPSRPLHARLLVEVNAKGQVVRVAHGDLSGEQSFDVMAIGNALQMWIRHPDGTAETGLYSVTYDYDPKTHNITRSPNPQLVKAGGSWANETGAATHMIADFKRQQEAAEARLQAEQKKKDAEKAKSLPDINAAVRRAMSSPSASPKP